MKTFEKDPDAILDYGVDWSDWLQDGDEINSSSWSVSPSGELSVVTDSETASTTKAECKLEAGTVGATYTVTNSIQTADGLEEDRSFKVYIIER